MATAIHKTYGVNKKKGLQGYQFNYPYDGCIFDKTNQRYAEFARGRTDDNLMHKFQIEYMFLPNRIINLKWKAIGMFNSGEIIC